MWKTTGLHFSASRSRSLWLTDAGAVVKLFRGCIIFAKFYQAILIHPRCISMRGCQRRSEAGTSTTDIAATRRRASRYSASRRRSAAVKWPCTLTRARFTVSEGASLRLSSANTARVTASDRTGGNTTLTSGRRSAAEPRSRSAISARSESMVYCREARRLWVAASISLAGAPSRSCRSAMSPWSMDIFVPSRW